MSKEVLRAIADIHTFPVISLVLFVAVFTIAVLRALLMDRQTADRMAALPLADEGDEAQSSAFIKGASRGA
ncbi:MAG TPA: hypothetical protein VIL25_00730 [Vicinamibacterales bacterium]